MQTNCVTQHASVPLSFFLRSVEASFPVSGSVPPRRLASTRPLHSLPGEHYGAMVARIPATTQQCST